ncbi:unnamed protein product, partial [Menidia menidia]
QQKATNSDSAEEENGPSSPPASVFPPSSAPAEAPESFSRLRLVCHLVVGVPYLLSTILLGLVCRDRMKGAVLLTIEPNRPQFFRYESFNLTCGGAGWMLMRTPSQPVFVCDRGGKRNGSSCINRSAHMSDSDRYWCLSQSGETSNGLDIIVTSEHSFLFSCPNFNLSLHSNVKTKV